VIAQLYIVSAKAVVARNRNKRAFIRM